MRRLAAVVAVAISAGPGMAGSADGVWTVTGYAGHGVYFDADRLVGETQTIGGDWAAGAFYQCEQYGQIESFVSHPMDAFLANPAYRDFAPAAALLREAGETATVHRITCSGASAARNRRVFTPFVTTEAGGTGFYLYEDAVFVLSWTRRP